MTSKRLYLMLIGAIVVLFIGLIAGTYEIGGVLGHKADTLTGLKAQDQALGQEQVSLTKAKSDIKKYAGLHEIAQSVVPEDKDQAEAVREIVKIAGANKISLASITFPASTLGAGPLGAGAATPAPASAATTPLTTNSKAAALSQLAPVKNIPGVYDLLITVTSDSNNPVPYSQFVSFLSDLEHNRRTAEVSTITITPKPENPNLLSFVLTLNEYIKPS